MPLQIPHPNTPLHIYRHLLRESTYLPNLCRSWVTSRIQTRFRECRFKTPSTPHVKQAHAALRNLRSANSGHVQRLLRLLYMATGRLGKRRRILSTTQLSVIPPSDTAELEKSRLEAPLSQPNHPTDDSATPLKQTWLENWSLNKISAIAHSQLSQQSNAWPQQMRRALDPEQAISGENCFGQPFRPKRAQNRLKNHWASVLRQLMPPLPEGEWDHLASLVTGDTNVDALRVPSRRPVAQSMQEDNTDSMDQPWDWSQHATRPAREIERGAARKMKSLTGMEDQDPRGHGRPIGLRVISPRKLQRLYGHIWEMSPILKTKPGNKYSVTWGRKELKVSAPSTKDLLFFQGVAEDGSVGNVDQSQRRR
ncbi:hypothetical protein GGS21DRAFT_367559 [Xylaria nigripes]|nr:hypothetical protein GGS21DRAFT_367559 [Xylaria nigripes]